MNATKRDSMKKSRKSNKSKLSLIRFEIIDSNAMGVCLAGTFNNWQCEPMSKSVNKRSTWIKELELVPGQYEYLFVVDGEWRQDPKVKETKPNPYGHANSVLTIS